jgi:hypothetical protein
MTRQDTEIAAAAHHESGHCIATVMAFRTARWLPPRAPLRPVQYVEIAADGGGNCQSADIYSTKWPLDCIEPRYRHMMEAQVGEISGGISEAIFRGEPETWRHYCSAVDLERAADVCRELRRLTGYAFRADDFAERTLTMLLANWPAVEAVAEALVDERRIEGRRIQRIIDRSMIGSAA